MTPITNFLLLVKLSSGLMRFPWKLESGQNIRKHVKQSMHHVNNTIADKVIGFL